MTLTARSISLDRLRQDSHGCISEFGALASHLCWIGWCHTVPNWIMDPLFRFSLPAWSQSREKFNFPRASAGVSQSNHIYSNDPVQLLANKIILCKYPERAMCCLCSRVTKCMAVTRWSWSQTGGCTSNDMLNTNPPQNVKKCNAGKVECLAVN